MKFMLNPEIKIKLIYIGAEMYLLFSNQSGFIYCLDFSKANCKPDLSKSKQVYFHVTYINISNVLYKTIF